MKKEWTATEGAFRQFLSWLDEGVDSDGRNYLEMRRRLVLYFDRKNCLEPDELADETLGRVARKLAERGQITDLSPAHYCYITARFVFLEYLRSEERRHGTIEKQTNDLPDGPALAAGVDGSAQTGERLLDNLDHCLDQLPSADRDLILEYYRGEGQAKIERRRKLAESLGLSPNALAIRACRIRSKVEGCVKASSEEG